MGVVSEGGSALCSGLWDKISTSNNLYIIYGALNETVKTLLAKRDDYQNKLQRHKSKKATNTYIDWVTKIENDVKDFEIRFEKEKIRSRIWGAGLRSEFCQELKDKHDIVVLLTKEGNYLGEFMVDPPPKPVELKGGPNIQKFYSFQMQDKILDLLRNDKVKGIRIHGMVGSGKTAIMQSLNNHEAVGKMFDIVVWVKVSTEGSKENLSTE